MNNYSVLLLAFAFACGGQKSETIETTTEEISTPEFPYLERTDALDAIIAPDTEVEVLAEGFEWSEGPVWIEDGGFLLFSDIPNNRVNKWKEGEGISVYLQPSGYTGTNELWKEPGSNGLLLTPDGKLMLCQHGDRRVALMDAPLSDPKSQFLTYASEYNGMKLNSPNDATFHSSGDLYFTDPPYGLPQQMDDSTKEIPFQGVYRRKIDGTMQLVTDQMTRPNGIALSPDEKTLYVANSDPEKDLWMAFDVAEDGSTSNGRVFYDATGSEGLGLCDGMTVHRSGIIFGTSPGGVFIMTPDAKLIGKVLTGQATANCTLDTNEKYLYITADMYLMRVAIK